MDRVTSTTYDDANLVVATTQDLATSPVQRLSASTYYDAVGRVRLSVDPAGNQVKKGYQYGSSASYELTSNPYATAPDAWTLTVRDTMGAGYQCAEL